MLGKAESGIIALVCTGKECESVGVSWKSRGFIEELNVYLDNEDEWLCPLCGDVGVVMSVAPIMEGECSSDASIEAEGLRTA